MTQNFSRPTLEQTQIVGLLREIRTELRGIHYEFKRFNNRHEPPKDKHNEPENKEENENLS